MKFIDNARIIEERKKVIIEYTEGREGRIRSDFQREQAVAKDYRGRELVELLQNAEDAAYEDEKTRGKGVVSIRLKNNILVIENTGKPFGFEGIHSLMLADDSPKDPVLTDVIGNKGLGFRSILSWADSIKITSRKVCVEFNAKSVKKLESEILAIKPNLQKELEDSSISVLSAPLVIEEGEHDSSFDTVIEIKCKDQYYNEKGLSLSEIIKAQIEEMIQSDVLVFLRNVNELIIQIDDEPRVYYVKNIVSEASIGEKYKRSEIIINNKDNDSQEWSYVVFNKSHLLNVYDDERKKKIDKKIELGLAIPKKHIVINNCLFSFFRTKIKNPFSFLLNATFELSQNRNELIRNDEVNKNVIELLIPFVFNSLSHYSKAAEDPFSLLKQLIFNDESFLSDYTFSNKFITHIKKKIILPNVNGEYIAPEGYLDDKEEHILPVYSLQSIDDVCNGELFNNLLKYTDNLEIQRFYQKLNIKKYDYFGAEYFSNLLTQFGKSKTYLNPIDKVLFYSKLIVIMKKEFMQTSFLPNLFLNDSVEIADEETKLFVYLDSEKRDLNPPSWLDLNFANVQQIETLCDLLSLNLLQLIKEFEDNPIKVFDFKGIIEVINIKVKDNWKVDKVIELHQWLFSQYISNQELFKSVASRLEIPVIYGKKENPQIAFAKEVYFPDHYENQFIHSLLKGSAAKFLSGRSLYSLNGNIELVIEYFSLIGVNKFPRLIEIKLSEEEFKEYFFFQTGKESIYSYLSSRRSSGKGHHWNIETVYTVTSIEHLDTILNNSFPMIMAFFNHIENNRKDIYNAIIGSVPERYININYEYSYSRYVETTYVSCKNYLWWKITRKAWLNYQHDGRLYKVEPYKCTFDQIDLHGFLEKPKIDLKEIQKIDKSISEPAIKAILDKLGVVNSISDLSVERMYDLLFALPTIDTTRTIGRRVYDRFFDILKSDEMKDNIYAKKFRETGKVCGVKNKVKDYYPVAEVNYSDNKTLCDEIMNDLVLFDFPFRKGVGKVSVFFGVKKLNSSILKIVDKTINYHTFNKDFQNEFNLLKPFIIVKRKQVFSKGDDDKKLKNTSVYLVSSLSAEYQLNANESKLYEISNYSFVWLDTEKKAYIVVPESLYYTCEELMRDTQFADALAEILCLVFGVSDGKESYRELIKENKNNRELLLEKDLGSNALIMLNETRLDFGIIISNKASFISTLKTISSANKVDGIMNDISRVNLELINYENINDYSSLIEIVKLFKLLKIDIDQFNSHSTVFNIDIVKFHVSNFNDLRQGKNAFYQSYIVTKSLMLPKEERMKFYQDSMKQFNFGTISFPNSVNVDYETVFEKNYGVSVIDLNDKVDVETIITANIKKYSELDPSNHLLLKDHRLIDYETYALLDILELFFEKGTKKDSVEVTRKDSAEIDYAVLIANVKDVEIDDKIEIIEIEKPAVKKNGNNPSKGKKSQNNNFGIGHEALKQENGFVAEFFAYNKLVAKYGQEKVNWVSKYSSYAFPDKSYDDGKHYDISYFDKEKEYYVEVKKITPDDLSFDITTGELEFGENNPTLYHLFCVAVEDKKPIPDESFMIKKMFAYGRNENFFRNLKFEVIETGFRIRATKKK